MTQDDILINLYKCITTNRDLKPGQFFQISGSMTLEGKIKAAVYSGDHGTHFHVLYPPGNIDAKFLWPSLEIEKYNSAARFSPKQVKNIRTMCQNPEIREFLQDEFDKRTAQEHKKQP